MIKRIAKIFLVTHFPSSKKTIRKLNNNIYGVKLRKKDLLAGNSIPISPTT
jgi:hypothetical protein